MEVIRSIIEQFPIASMLEAERIQTGHVNESYHVRTTEGEYLLQKINDALGPVTEDIYEVTEYVHARGILTQRIIMTRAGNLVHKENGSWRLSTWIPGRTLVSDPTLEEIASAATCVAKFHMVLADYPYTFRHIIPHFHDTAFILNRMREIDTAHTADQKYPSCHVVASAIFAIAARLPKLPALSPRAVHGDPKLANVIFNEKGEAIALVDLDAVGRYPLPMEIGDMLRSLCATKNQSGPMMFRADAWHAALDAYRRNAPFIKADETAAILDGFRLVTLELAARYLTDAYEESFFAFDGSRYQSAFEQNLERAQRLLGFLEDAERQL